MNKVNLVPIYSQNTRKVALGLSLGGITLLAINLILNTPFVNTSALLWCITFLLACVNFSKLGRDDNRDQLSRYITLKLTVSYFIGFLMSISFVEIFFNVSMPSIALITVLSSNIVFIVSHYILYYFGMDSQTELNDEGFNTLIQSQKPLLVTVVILSLISFLFIYLWF